MLRLLTRTRPTRSFHKPKHSPSCYISYVQGQEPKPGIREYFYYIDHQGQLFLDDTRVKNFITCFKDKEFLNFFFQRVKVNNTDQHCAEFPFLSLCGRERNYIRCDDVPIVFDSIITRNNEYLLTYGGAGDKLTYPFQVSGLCMLSTGRVYHPSSLRTGGIGLIKSSLAIDISQYFVYENSSPMPTHFTWNNEKHKLTLDLYHKYNLKSQEEK